MARTQRAAGALFGLAYGDALARPTEFLNVAQIVARYGPGGPRDLEGDPALVTDDTQMALAVGWALHELEPVSADEVSADHLAPLLRQRFVAWSVHPDNNRAPGATCMAACAALSQQRPWQDATVIGSKGCGANMRVAPVGLVPGYDVETVAGVAQLQAGMTHGHPTGLAASELTAYAVWLLRRDDATLTGVPAALRERCRSERRRYREDWLGALWHRSDMDSAERFIATGWDECLEALDRLDAALAQPDDGGDPCAHTGEGWVAEEALATALLCVLRHPDDPVAALARAATTSGDSDSIACLAGAIVGAAYGFAYWPSAWAARIEYADQLGMLANAWEVDAG